MGILTSARTKSQRFLLPCVSFRFLSPLFASLRFPSPHRGEARPKPNPVAPTQKQQQRKKSCFFYGLSSSSARRVASNLAGAAGDGSVPVAARGLPRTRAPTPTGGAARFSAGLSSGSPDRRRAGAACWWRLAGFVAVSVRAFEFFLFFSFSFRQRDACGLRSPLLQTVG
jgi:hypothetical protein